MASATEVGYRPMSNGGDRVLSGPEFRAYREERCPDLNMQQFALLADVPVRTLSNFELGKTKRPHEYDKLMRTVEDYSSGRLTAEAALPIEERISEEEVFPGITWTMSAKDFATLGDYLAARAAMHREAEHLRKTRSS